MSVLAFKLRLFTHVMTSFLWSMAFHLKETSVFLPRYLYLNISYVRCTGGVGLKMEAESYDRYDE